MRKSALITSVFFKAVVVVILMTGTCRAEPLPHYSRVENSVNTKLLRESSSIDVVYSEGVFSHIEYQKSAAEVTAAEAILPLHVIERPRPIPFGACKNVNGTFQRAGRGVCGIVIRFSASALVNLSAMDLVELRGTFSGKWRLALVDLSRYLMDDNLPTGVTVGSQGASLDLAPFVGTVDLTRMMSLVLLLDSSEGTADPKQMRISRSPQTPGHKPAGVWIWNNRLVTGHEQEVVETLLKRGVGRVYLQIDDDPGRFLPFVGLAKAKGIEVFALDGDPGYIRSPEPLLKRIGAVADLARSAPGATFAGFQIDIEPYLNKDFTIEKEYYVSAYLELLDTLKKRGGIPLSVVVPFWFDSLHVRGATLLQKVIEAADELVVMSYRTASPELLAITRTELGLAEKLGKPVRLGIELGRISDERHIELKPSGEAGDLLLAGKWWKKKADYVVPGDRISFKNRMDTLPAYMKTDIPFHSFGGWVLHSYEELGHMDK